MALGALLALVLGVVGARVDASRAKDRDDGRRGSAVEALRSELSALDGRVGDLAGLFEASHDVEPDEFAAFTAPMLNRSHANALIYVVGLDDSERAAFERRTGVRLTQLDRDGALSTEPRRPRYMVVEREAYADAGPSLIGLDVWGDAARRATITRARRTQAVAVTGPVKLVHGLETGIIMYAPVRGKGDRVVAGGFATDVLARAVDHALAPGDALRLRLDGTTLASSGKLPAGVPEQAVAFGGERFLVQASAAPASGLGFGAGGVIVGLVATLLAGGAGSIRRARRRVAVGEARFADAFDASPIGQGLAGLDGCFARVNGALCEITGHRATELDGLRVAELVHAADRGRAQELMEHALSAPGVAAGAEVRVLTSGGATRWVQLHFTRLSDPGAVQPLLAQLIDVSDRRGLEVELRHQAEHDSLTELLNRRGLQRRLALLLEHGAPGAVLLVDLDHFKAVNDTLGHHVGDQVIQQAGHALRGSLRPDDTVARIGGDEFAVLLPGADRDRARATADRLVEAIRAEGLHGVTASVGVAMLEGAFATADEALMAADLAMYDAKAAGRRRAAVYDDHSPSGTRAGLEWVDQIRGALKDDRFALLAQPIKDLATGRVVHHEILLRMLDADGGHVGPDSFLPIAEQFGLMGEIDCWVVARSIRALAANRDRELVLEINLSGSSLGSTELLAAIRRELEAGAVEPSRVVFELTETAAVTNLEAANAFAEELAALGCRFALDDFGVGFGSFSYVKHLPFDFLKIDGEFVRHSATAANDRVILESLIHAARGLGKRTIAEYVEDGATEALLRELGVDMVQGYHIGRPRELAAVIAAAPAQGSVFDPRR